MSAADSAVRTRSELERQVRKEQERIRPVGNRFRAKTRLCTSLQGHNVSEHSE